jgi:site-specific recombinase XerC
VHLHGKGRKQRSVPLWRSTIKAIRAWLKQSPDGSSSQRIGVFRHNRWK